MRIVPIENVDGGKCSWLIGMTHLAGHNDISVSGGDSQDSGYVVRWTRGRHAHRPMNRRAIFQLKIAYK